MNVDQALARLLERAGSDLLISSGSRPRIRKDGRLEPLEGDGEVLTPTDTERMIRDVLDADELKELETKRHVDFSFTWRERARIRGNAYYQRNSMAAAFRLLPLEIPSFDMLGIPESVHRLLEKQHGLLLVTGPFASGKSTTQAAIIDHLNATRPFHIITIEDPIEYVHKHKLAIVDQRQVGEDTPSFAEGLRGAFREDPDVVLIGEMRDLETISAAVSIAEAGHLVMGTLHTNDAPQAIDRIIDSYLGAQQQQVRIQLAMCLAGVIYQQLLPAGRGRGGGPKTRERTRHGGPAMTPQGGGGTPSRLPAARAAPAPDRVAGDRDQIDKVEHAPARTAMRAGAHNRFASRQAVRREVDEAPDQHGHEHQVGRDGEGDHGVREPHGRWQKQRAPHERRPVSRRMKAAIRRMARSQPDWWGRLRLSMPRWQ